MAQKHSQTCCRSGHLEGGAYHLQGHHCIQMANPCISANGSFMHLSFEGGPRSCRLTDECWLSVQTNEASNNPATKGALRQVIVHPADLDSTTFAHDVPAASDGHLTCRRIADAAIVLLIHVAFRGVCKLPRFHFKSGLLRAIRWSQPAFASTISIQIPNQLRQASQQCSSRHPGYCCIHGGSAHQTSSLAMTGRG